TGVQRDEERPFDRAEDGDTLLRRTLRDPLGVQPPPLRARQPQRRLVTGAVAGHDEPPVACGAGRVFAARTPPCRAASNQAVSSRPEATSAAGPVTNTLSSSQSSSSSPPGSDTTTCRLARPHRCAATAI